MMNGLKKSDEAVRPVRAANKGARASAESPEERASTKGNPDCQSTRRTQCRVSVPQAAARIRKAAERNPKERLTALFHHITPDALGAAYFALKKDAAAGVDGVTWDMYGEGLDERLLDLHRRLHRGGAYRAPPVRRVEIPKPDGGTRPLGIAALEDKVVQKAVVDVILTPIYEVVFLGFSYGFRPGRGAHDALDALAFWIERRKVSWIVDADLRAYFDTIPRDWLITFLEHRIGDRRVIRLIRKLLNAGVIESGSRADTGMGTPQGAIVSPVLANVFLHYVLDLWFHKKWRPNVPDGEAIIVRYADDIVVGFQHKRDAERYLRDVRETQCRVSVPQAAARIRKAAERNPKERLTALFHHITPDALDALAFGIERRKVSWIVDADLRAYFDTIPRDWLITFLEHRIGDRRVIRLIRKWLNAGVIESGSWADTGMGTPQGAIVSPVLANVFLHYVLDLWFHKKWRPNVPDGEAIIVRYADDIVVGFQHKRDAERYLRDVRERLARFGLSLHQDKTRLVEFGRFADLNRRQRGVGKPETFDFLGLTHYCTTTLRGRFRLGRKPVAKRVNRTLARIDEVLRKRWHHDIWEVGRWLGRVCNGWLNYFAVPGSGRFIRAFLRRLQRRWMRALRRRSQRARFSWKRLERMTEILWPRASIRHPWPDQRFAVKHPR